jgi:hypothetical protein
MSSSSDVHSQQAKFYGGMRVEFGSQASQTYDQRSMEDSDDDDDIIPLIETTP